VENSTTSSTLWGTKTPTPGKGGELTPREKPPKKGLTPLFKGKFGGVQPGKPKPKFKTQDNIGENPALLGAKRKQISNRHPVEENPL